MKSCTRCGAAFEGEGEICPHCEREAAEAARWTPAAPAVTVSEVAAVASAAVAPPAEGRQATVEPVAPNAPDHGGVSGEAAEGEGEAAEAADGDEGVSRRRFLTNTALTVGGVIGVGYAALAVRYLFPNVSSTATALQDVGPVSNFAPQSPTLEPITYDNVQDGVFVTNLSNGTAPTTDEMLALDIHCPHLNCPVTWVPGVDGVGRYICPCHGSEFTIQGVHVAGPAIRPMFRHQLVLHNGRVLVGGIIS